MDKIHSMRLFLQVADLQSFTKTAELSGLPKGTVSRHIGALEQTLGTRLFDRTTRRVNLTPEGRLYYARCRDLLADFDDLSTLFQHGNPAVHGRLRVAIPGHLARELVLPKLGDFLQRYPGIALDLESHTRSVDISQEGFDCALYCGFKRPEGTSLIHQPLGRLTQIHCASPAYLQRFGDPQTLDDLASHAMVHLVTSSDSPAGFEVWLNGAVERIKTGGMLSVNTTETLHGAALAGLGIIQVSRLLVKNWLRTGRLIEILPYYRPRPIPVVLLTPRRQLTRQAHLFTAWLTERLQDNIR